MAQQGLLPIEADGERVTILSSDPLNADVFEEITFFLDQDVAVFASHTHGIRRLLDVHLSALKGDQKPSELQHERDRSVLANRRIDGPIIRFVAQQLDNAVIQGASDVHFASTSEGLGVRFRINGFLTPQPIYDMAEPSAAFARTKLLAGMNAAERRRPQDGRMTSIIGGRVIDFRVSSLPTTNGESIACGILDPNSLRLGWDQLRFDRETSAALCRMIQQPNGLFIVTGPTGSGQTTTLYTALQHLNQSYRKNITEVLPVVWTVRAPA